MAENTDAKWAKRPETPSKVECPQHYGVLTSVDCTGVEAHREPALEQDTILTTDTHSTESNHTVSSNESTVCRICQLTEKETGENLHETGCHCRGSIRFCHRSCLEEWIKSRLSAQCELCTKPFGLEIVPINTSEPAVLQVTPCDNSRRVWFVVILLLVIFATGASSALTVYTHQDYLDIQEKASHPESGINPKKVEDFRFCYGLSLSILIFAVSLGMAVWLLWMISETRLWPQERAMQQQWNELNEPYLRETTRTYVIVERLTSETTV